MSKSSWYIFNKGSAIPRVDIYGDIGWENTINSFVSEFNSIDAPQIDLHIASNGGSIFEGYAIYENIKNHKAKVVVHIDGLAASMATVIAMAGDEIEISENGWMMIHNPAIDLFGESSELRKAADLMDSLKNQCVSIYAARTGLGEDELNEMLDAETWMNAEDALRMGFVDRIGEPIKAVASLKQGKFRNAPSSLIEAVAIQPKKQPTHTHMIDKNALVNRGVVKASASDEDALSQLDEYVANATEAVASAEDMAAGLAKAEARIEELETEAKAAAEASLDAKADAAVASGKISKEIQNTYRTLLSLNEVEAEKFLNSIGERKAVQPTQPLNVGAPQGDSDDDAKLTITEKALAAKAKLAASA